LVPSRGGGVAFFGLSLVAGQQATAIAKVLSGPKTSANWSEGDSKSWQSKAVLFCYQQGEQRDDINQGK
jgi:hypothetical protein